MQISYQILFFWDDYIAALVKIQLYKQNLILYYFEDYLSACPLYVSFFPFTLSLKSKNQGVRNTEYGVQFLSPQQERDNNIVAVKKNYDVEEFYKWFVGFSDAESSFGIFPRLNKKTKIESFSFKFTIGLHKDDLYALNYIKSKLGIGYVYSYNDSKTFIVTKKEDIQKLISIFDKYTLNTSKYLDFIDFKKAFILYHKRENLTEELIAQILELKNNMNTNRTNFNIPENHIVITKSWLLGLIEGDGSFSLARTTLEPVFSIKLTEKQLPVLIKIKEYLENNLGFDLYSMHKLKCSSVITISTEKSGGRNNSKPLVTFMIKNVHILNNYFIPFFSSEEGAYSSQEFITKKGKDFSDFKIICKAIYIGAHRREEIKSLILKLSYMMNNFRLSTHPGPVESLSKNEWDLLINATPTIEHLSDGRQRDIVTKKVVHRRSSSCVYEIIKPTGEVLIKPNLSEAAKIVGTGFNTLKKRLDVEKLEGQGKLSVEFKNHLIKRIPVFYPKVK